MPDQLQAAQALFAPFRTPLLLFLSGMLLAQSLAKPYAFWFYVAAALLHTVRDLGLARRYGRRTERDPDCIVDLKYEPVFVCVPRSGISLCLMLGPACQRFRLLDFSHESAKNPWRCTSRTSACCG